MSQPKFTMNQLVWFLKSMRICTVVEILPKRRQKDEQQYIVQRVDNRKQLYADEKGLAVSIPGDNAEVLLRQA